MFDTQKRAAYLGVTFFGPKEAVSQLIEEVRQDAVVDKLDAILEVVEEEAAEIILEEAIKIRVELEESKDLL